MRYMHKYKYTLPLPLADLSRRVTWFKHFSLQRVRLPYGLHTSEHTLAMTYEIDKLTKQLRDSVTADYQRQKAAILSKREVASREKKEFDNKNES